MPPKISPVLFSSILWATACSSRHDPVAPGPTLYNVTVASATDAPNVVRVTFDSTGFVAARVRYRSAEESGETEPHTLADGRSTVAVVGLLADHGYAMELVLSPPAGSEHVYPVTVRTAALPPVFAAVRCETSGDAAWPGYLLVDVPTPLGRMAIAFDAQGRVRWYFHAPGLGSYSGQLANGNLAAFFGNTFGWQPTYGYFVEVAADGEIVARHQAPAGFYTDEHELLVTQFADGSWRSSLFTYDIRTVDMTRYGGRPNARIAGHQIVRYAEDGSLDFHWNAWDHVGLDELIEPIGGVKEADIDHPNSLEFDRDGHYIVSMRNLSQVMKIDSATGRVIWRLGGTRNEFTVRDDPLTGFSAQHCARILANGNLLLFDNGTSHATAQSRAVEYALDTATRVATMVWEYRPEPPIYTAYTGSVQRLANGNTLVGFAYVGRAQEVTPAREVVWEARVLVDGSPALTYRMQRIASLTQFVGPEEPTGFAAPSGRQ